MRKEKLFELVRTLLAVALALIIAFIIILFISKQPGEALRLLLVGPVTKLRYFGNVIEMAIPLTFTGLAVCVMFQAKQFNMAGEGAFFIGAIAAAIVGILVPLPKFIHPMAAIIAGGLVGGFFLYIIAKIKTKWNASELVSSLMLNYILLYLGLFIINYLLRDSNAGAMASVKLRPTALIPNLIPKTRIHFGLLIVIAMIFITYYFLYRTKWGYAIRMTGLNQKFANYSGINTINVVVYSQVIGGIIAGIGGATELLGMYKRFQWQTLPGYGWDGMMVAILARNNPALVPIAAFLLAFLRIGADLMARMTDVPSEVVSIIQAIMIILVAAESFLSTWRHKMIVKQAKEEITVKGVTINE